MRKTTLAKRKLRGESLFLAEQSRVTEDTGVSRVLSPQQAVAACSTFTGLPAISFQVLTCGEAGAIAIQSVALIGQVLKWDACPDSVAERFRGVQFAECPQRSRGRRLHG